MLHRVRNQFGQHDGQRRGKLAGQIAKASLNRGANGRPPRVGDLGRKGRDAGGDIVEIDRLCQPRRERVVDHRNRLNPTHRLRNRVLDLARFGSPALNAQ